MRRIAGTAIALAIGVSVAVAAPAQADTAPPSVPRTISPVADRTATGVTADALPTVQIDGVVWSQAIVGNTVYAGGSFANARPAGAPVGSPLSTPRTNLLAYNLTTGALITSFDPVLNNQVLAVAASPDGSRLYIGGDFTSVNGQNHYRIAAFNTSTGQLVSSFDPGLDTTVRSITATNTTVYVGGIFSMANNTARSRLAAFSAADGSLLDWAPTADAVVNAVQLTPDGTHVIVGGTFSNLSGTAALGLGSVDATTGLAVPFQVNQVVKNYGGGSAITSLTTDGTAIYGTGYDYSGGKFEGTFSADPGTGAINWLEDCHGDTYGAYAHAGQVYVVSHEHYCGNIGGFPETNPRTAHRTTAFTTDATGTVTPNQVGNYASYGGQPSPSLINWFPDLTPGTFTKQDQAAWTVTGNGRYVVEGGEFLDVNGAPQQGLVRFAVPSIAPKKRGPADRTGVVSALPTSNTSAHISWPANWDPDNATLTYKLYYTGTSTPIFTVSSTNQFWNRPTFTYDDTNLVTHRPYTYKVVASDADGNTLTTYSQSINPGGPPAPTTTKVANVRPTSVVVGQPVTADVSVARMDTTLVTGSVAVSVDGGTPQNLTLEAGGHVPFTTSFPTPGQHTITATFKGDDANTGSSATSTPITVTRAATAATAAVTTANPVAGQAVSVRNTVGAMSPGTGTPTGTVTVAVDGIAAPPTTLTKAVATTKLAGLPAGPHTVTVTYNGETSYTPSPTSDPVAFTVSPASTTTSATVSPAAPVAGQAMSLHSVVGTVSPGSGAATGTVTVTVDGTPLTTSALTGAGAATTALGRLPVGKHTITVDYGGDANHLKSTRSLTLTVSRASTASKATVSPATPVTGQKMSLHTTVRTVAPGTTRATGTVTVTVDGEGTRKTALTKAVATTALPGLRAGKHTIKVSYSGDATHKPSTYTRTITVAPGRTTSRVTSSAKKPTAHTTLHLKASVVVVSPAKGTPTGKVYFYVDGHHRATGTLRSGTVTYSVKLPKGRHTIKVTYRGSSGYRTSTSRTISQTVR